MSQRKKDPTPTPTTAVAVIDPTATTLAVNALCKTAGEFVAYTASKAGVKRLLADPTKLAGFSTVVNTFISIDSGFEGGTKALGSMCQNILNIKEKDLQIKLFTAMYIEQGLEPPAEIATGRAGLARVLFARYPEMFRMGSKSKDTPAGMRITYYMRVAAGKTHKVVPIAAEPDATETTENAGTADSGDTEAAEAKKSLTVNVFWAKLRAAADEDEKEILDTVLAKAGFTFETAE